jgi:aryl carrier-like protein
VIRPPFHPLGYIGEPIRSGFFDSPFGGRALRTGDAGRYRPDGLLEVCGRIDQQVKIRGVRVEPEGVRAVLASHPGVRACAVVTRPDADGNAELVAYVVSTCEEKEEEVTAAQLRAFLAHRLPGGMIPQHLVFTDELPRTLNGKVDERALPPPTAWSPPPPGPLPPTPTERVVASLWEKVLGAETVQPHDNFFDCGGHSLLGMTLLAQIHQRFNVKLTLKNLFEAQTVTALSKLIDRSPRTEAAAEPPLRRVSREKYQTG